MGNWYLAAGDWNYWWQERIASLSWLPQVFDPATGQSHLLSLWLDYPFRLIVKILSTAGLSWFFIEKLFWLTVPLLAIYSSYQLARHILGKNGIPWVSSLIYSTNTYILLVIGGGQLGVSWAYAFAPLVLLKFIQMIDGKSSGIKNGLWVALLVAFDLRIAYITLLGIGLYALIQKKLPILSFAISLIVAALVHSFWIVPLLFASTGLGGLHEDFTNVGMLHFLSASDFSHALGLLHPNWPENLFGKVYFLQPEFIVLPIVAFAALLWKEQKMRFFALLGLVGAFLAKGTQEPFGSIFEWLFTFVPGFVMFRDPTKFYLFMAIAYSILIPYTLKSVMYHVSGVMKKLIIAIFVAFWIFTIRQLFTGQLAGTFRPGPVSAEYVQLKEKLVLDSEPSRTLWIPTRSPYAYFSDTHPALSTGSAFVQTPGFLAKINEMGVKYVIVPPLDGRNQQERAAILSKLDKTNLIRDKQFSQLAVYRNDEFSFSKVVPPEVARQQKLANIGVAISAVVLVVVLLWIRFF